MAGALPHEGAMASERHRISRFDDDADFAASFVLNRDDVQAAVATVQEQLAAPGAGDDAQPPPNHSKILLCSFGAALSALMLLLLFLVS